MSKTIAKPWPRLTESLTGPKTPGLCQSCGGCCDLDRWREHGDQDEPEGRVVVLCIECSDRLIEAHPRFYSRLDTNQPWPGCMRICVACEHRDGVDCLHPDLGRNGGAGLGIETPQARKIFMDGQDDEGEHHGFIHVSYPHEPKKCMGYRGRDVISLVEFRGVDR